MDYDKLKYFLSEPRLNRFLIAVGNSKDKAEKLYKANIEVAQSFYPVLNLFETLLRNSINNQLSKHFKDADWIINQKNGFMSDPSLQHSKFWLKNQIINAEKNTKLPITSGKIVSEQHFSVWSEFFSHYCYKLVQGSVINCFPNRPSNIKRSDIAETLKRIRQFRNRIYHNEAICFHENKVDFSNAINIRTDIYNLLCWMDKDIAKYVESYDNIEVKINQALSL